jgi:predicted DNA-binding transcriptional regulator YafY
MPRRKAQAKAVDSSANAVAEQTLARLASATAELSAKDAEHTAAVPLTSAFNSKLTPRQRLETAIKDHKEVEIHYKDDPGNRTVEPKDISKHKNTGNELLLAYQTGGYSSQSTSTGIRNFKVAEIDKVTLTGKTFANDQAQDQVVDVDKPAKRRRA